MIRISLWSRVFRFFTSSPAVNFWEECRRLHLTLSRLNEKQPNAISHLLLRKASSIFDTQDKDYALAECCYLYGAWCALVAYTGERHGSGFETSDDWLICLDRADDHFINRVVPLLPKTNFLKVHDSLVSIYNNISKTISAGDLGSLNIENMLEIDIFSLLEI